MNVVNKVVKYNCGICQGRRNWSDLYSHGCIGFGVINKNKNHMATCMRQSLASYVAS